MSAVRGSGHLVDTNKNIDLFALKKFLNRFSGSYKSPGMILTLNHDVLLERLFKNDRHYLNFLLPFVDLSVSEKSGMLSKYDVVSFKNNEDYKYSTHLEKLSAFDVNVIDYIKLHGSFNWRDENNNLLIVLGEEKEKNIQGINMLSEYADIFKEILAKNPKILCIGYSFNDNHINKLFDENEVEIQVVNPLGSSVLYETLNKKDEVNSDKLQHKKNIWEKRITNYYQTDLRSLFSKNIHKSKTLREIEINFFDDD
ncbi:MAG: SIR2 family protein [Candidatus Berkiella sp.]